MSTGIGSGFSIPGIGSGIDWGTYISSIKKQQLNALARTLGTSLVKSQGAATTYQQIQGLVQDFQTAITGFQDARDFKTKSVASSDTDVITGTASLTAINQTATVRVSQLATNEKWVASFSGVSDSVTNSDGSIVINVRGADKTVSVTAGDTLTNLADKINAANIGVTATVFAVNDGSTTPARLVITDNLSGQADSDNTTWHANISFTSSTLTQLTTGAFTNQVQGQDSKAIINNTTVYRDTNEVSDVLPGVTLSLLKADTVNDKTITVTESLGAAATKIQAFVDKYNALVKGLKQAIFYNTDPNAQTQLPTAGDSTLRGILSQLGTSMTSSLGTLPADAGVKSLADLGISTVFQNGSGPNDGTLSFDASKFNAKLAANFDDVIDFFQGVTLGSGESATKYDGFATYLGNLTASLLDSTNGSITNKIKQLNDDSTRYQDEINKKSQRISRQEEALKVRFARLETVLAQLGTKQNSLNALVNSMSKNNS